ncbi:hypothetical protein [Bradyrhizobium sp.]|uniref:hypothetical protein n=1 Tax=Bradyrhizobium sp. TaxID=376 RepID=UPI003C50FF2F
MLYDEEHVVTYLRVLDVSAEGAAWREVARIVLHIDPDREPYRAVSARGHSVSHRSRRTGSRCSA